MVSGTTPASLVRYSSLSMLLMLTDSDKTGKQTAIVREESETPNDRNDRGASLLHHRFSLLIEEIGIRTAIAWYNTHLSLTRPPIRGQTQTPHPIVVLMTEDAANRQKAEQSGISSISGIY